jgi:hypothetical protein
MTGISLITAEGTAAEGVAADDAEGGGAETGRDADHESECLTGQGIKAAHDNSVERTVPAEMNPAYNAEEASGAEHATLAVRTPPEAPATNAEDVVRASVEEANEATSRPTEGDTDDSAHTAEFEAALLAVSSTAREARPEDAGAAETDPPPAATAETEV